MEKRLFVQLNGNRKVIGILRGYDVFLNIVLDEAVEEKAGGERQRLGMVVRLHLRSLRSRGSHLHRSFAAIQSSCSKLSNALEGTAIVDEQSHRNKGQGTSHILGISRNARGTTGQGLLYKQDRQGL